MYNKERVESGNRGGCGSWTRGGFGGPWGRGKFGHRHGGWGGPAWGGHRPPVNIEETDADYKISLYAAGLVKEDVKLSVKDDVLTIAYAGVDTSGANTQGEKSATNAGNFTYQEHYSRSFERSFQLNNKVLTDAISATYTDGVLVVTLPKNPATNVPAQAITVA